MDLSILLIWALIAIYFSLETALDVSQRFWHVVSSFSLVSKNFFISAFLSLFTQSTFKSQLFHGHRKGSTKHWGLLGGKAEGQWEGAVGRDSLGRNAKCG